MICRSREYFSEPLSGELLYSVIAEHEQGAQRIERLKASYENRRGINARKRTKGLPNNKLAHGFPRYIVTMTAGYLLGKPIAYKPDKPETQRGLDTILDAYSKANVDSVDIELARNAAIYGSSAEIVFADSRSMPRSAALEPGSAFVCYDDTVEHRPIFGVHILAHYPLVGDGGADGYSVTVYTDNHIYGYRVPYLKDIRYTEHTTEKEHYFGGVPLIEYWNSEDERGDFEPVESLIDAYDTLESDRVNDKEQLADAILVVTGARIETNDETGKTPAQQIRENKLLFLPDKDCTAAYLHNAMDDAGAEALKKSIEDDIHKFSLVPDLTDAKFSGNTSGVAMQYKLLGLEQLMRSKESWFSEGLRERLRLYARFFEIRGAKRVNPETVRIIFERSMPQNALEAAQTQREMMQTVTGYSGLVPDGLLLAQVPFITDAEGAKQQLQEQKLLEDARATAAFVTPQGLEE